MSIAVVVASLTLVASGLMAPVAAAAPAKGSSGWVTRHHEVAHRHLASARQAAVDATASLLTRRVLERARPTVKQDHTPAAGRAPSAATHVTAPRSATGGATPLLVVPPDVVATQTFAGIDQDSGGGYVPP